MDSYAIARAESRISELEFEIRRLKFDAERLSSDVQRMEWAEKSRLRFMDDFFYPMLLVGGCAILGACFGEIIGRLIKLALA